MNVVRRIESTPTLAGDKPEQNVVISAAGHIPVEEAFAVDKEDSKDELWRNFWKRMNDSMQLLLYWYNLLFFNTDFLLL